MDDCWGWLRDNADELRRRVGRACSRAGRSDLVDAVLSEVYEALPRRWARLDDRPPDAYLFSCLKWDAWHAVQRLSIGAAHEELDDAHLTEELDQDASIDARMILERLSSEDRYLLELKYVYEYTFEEVADLLGCSKGHAVKQCQDAVRRARNALAKELGG